MNQLYKHLNSIKVKFDHGENILDFLAEEYPEADRAEGVMISYDLQAGSYTRLFDSSPEKKCKYCHELAKKIESLDPVDSFLLVGAGEGITLGNVISRLSRIPTKVFGFDISWSRIEAAQKFLKRFNFEFTLSTGDLFKAPFMDNSIELVMSNHSLEPNGKKEKEALVEMYRVSSKYVVINEPCYEFATSEGRRRIDRLGYVKDLHIEAQKLGYEIVSHEKFDHPISNLNPTSCLIIKKTSSSQAQASPQLACPITRTPLVQHGDCYFSPESLLAYPIIKGIPCLLDSNAVIASSLAR